MALFGTSAAQVGIEGTYVAPVGLVGVGVAEVSEPLDPGRNVSELLKGGVAQVLGRLGSRIRDGRETCHGWPQKVPVPLLVITTKVLAPAAAMSGLPSPLKSPTATDIRK